MKLQCEWMVLCERVINDSQSNNLSLITCLEQVQALSFPSLHHGFAVGARFRVEAPPAVDHDVEYRIIRESSEDPPEVVCTLPGKWRSGTMVSRIAINFDVLRLTRPETLWFRIEHRVKESAWVDGARVAVEIVQHQLTEEQFTELASLDTTTNDTPNPK